MKQESEMVRKFFEDYERGVNASDHEPLIANYNDLLVFISPHGVQVIKKDDFVKVLPKRHGFRRLHGMQEMDGSSTLSCCKVTCRTAFEGAIPAHRCATAWGAGILALLDRQAAEKQVIHFK